MKLKLILSAVIFCLITSLAIAQDKQIYQADPTIFYHHKTYYLYGTGGEGFRVYTSTDLVNWEDKGLALKKGDAFGNKGFWAPQVFQHQGKFYMAYVADEHIAIAESDSPLGSFVQAEKKPIAAPVRMIDAFIYFEGGKIYMYHVRLDNGNRIFVAEMTDDLKAIKPETLKECINATQPWEDTQNAQWKVTEGPTVLKRKGVYYLFYSANDFRNPDYAVGYAISNSPLGPWVKHATNPLISKVQTGENGSGHGDFLTDGKGRMYYVFHTHQSNQKNNGRRRTAIIETKWEKAGKAPDTIKLVPNTFRFLQVK